jgi:hypothetical protein
VGEEVGVGPDEGRQLGVVDVDDPALVSRDELRGEDLHVAGEDHQVYCVLKEKVKHRGFLLGLGLFGDRQVVKGDIVELRA